MIRRRPASWRIASASEPPEAGPSRAGRRRCRVTVGLRAARRASARDERVALLAVAGAHAAQVAVELAARDEVGERVLLDAALRGRRRASRPSRLRAARRERRASRDAAPARASCSSCRRRRSAPARAPAALRRPRGRSDTRRRSRPRSRRAALAQPGDQRRAPLAAEHDAGRLLMRRGDDHGVGRSAPARRLGCRRRRRRRAGPRGRRPVTMPGRRGCSDPPSPIRFAPPAARARQTSARPWRVAGGDDHAPGLGDHAPHPPR